MLCWEFSDFVRRASSALKFSDLPSSRFSTTIGCSGKAVEISYWWTRRLTKLLNGLRDLLGYHHIPLFILDISWVFCLGYACCIWEALKTKLLPLAILILVRTLMDHMFPIENENLFSKIFIFNRKKMVHMHAYYYQDTYPPPIHTLKAYHLVSYVLFFYLRNLDIVKYNMRTASFILLATTQIETRSYITVYDF